MSMIQGPYRATGIIGDTRVAALPGSRLDMPMNYQIPPFASNLVYQLQYFEGLQFPQVDFNLLPMSSWLTAANLNAWLARTSDDASSIASGVTLFDGARGYVLQHGAAAGAKMARVMIGGSQGAPLRTRVSFWGTSVVYSEPATSIITDNIANFNRVSFSSSTGWTGVSNIISFDLTIDNNLMPNPELNGSLNPTEINAGIMTASLSLVLQADKEAPTNEDDISILIDADLDGVTDLTIVCANLLVQNPYLREVQGPRPLKTYECICLAMINGTAPVVIS